MGRFLWNGVRRRCPRCGRGRLFRGFYTELDSCTECGLVFDPNNESFGMFFVSTAALTGLCFFLLYVVKPRSPETAQYILLPFALALYLGTMPQRKGIAIALIVWLRGT